MHGVSIIAPYNGSPYLQEFISNLLLQKSENVETEILLVNGTGREINLQNSELIRIIQCPISSHENKHTAGMLRNAGAQASKFDLLFFIDSDCLIQPSCLFQHVNILKHSDVNVSCGLMRELPARYRTLIPLNTFDTTIILKDYREKDDQSEVSEACWEEMYSCNFMVHKKLFNSTGGFDELGYRCHDMDLGYRIHKAGGRFYLNKRAIVIHIDHFRSINYRINQIRGWNHLGKKYSSEIGERCSKRIDAIRHSYKEVLLRCEAKFMQLHASLFAMPIVRVGKYLIADSDNEQLRKAIRKFVIEYKIKEGSTTIHLQLNRDCWDFGLIIPSNPKFELPFFSVIIPAWNSDETIVRAIESVYVQSFQSFEIVVIDDKSSDKTLQRLKAFHRSKRFRIITNDENVGLAKCMNTGLQQSKGKYIIQLDSDDSLEPNALEIIYQFIAERGSDAAYGAAIVHRDNKVERVKGWQVRSPMDCLEYNSVQAPRVYKKDFLYKIGGWPVNDGYEGRYFEDRLILSRCFEKGKVDFMNKYLYNVYSNPKSLSKEAPLRVASAKLAILYNEANKAGKNIDFKFQNGYLHGKFRNFKFNAAQKSWSIIIPFSRNEEHLKFTLNSWKQGSVGRNKIEIIVVNNSGRELLLNPCEFPELKIINNDSVQNPAFARNVGARAAQNDSLFFCDEDHIVAPQVLTAHEDCHFKNSKRIVIGGVFGRKSLASTLELKHGKLKKKILNNLLFDDSFELIASAIACDEEYHAISCKDPDLWKNCFKYSFTDSWLSKWGEILVAKNADLSDYSLAWLRCGTGNLSVSKELFFSLGGFDESLYSMEDWELGIRAVFQGVNIHPLPLLEPFHLIHGRDPDRKKYNDDSFKYIKIKHPEAFKGVNAEKALVPPGLELFEDSRYNTCMKTETVAEVKTRKSLISFDDGPHEYGTHVMLDKLNELGLTATFFVLGEKAKRNKDLIERICKEGHSIGLHGWNHIPFYNMSENEVLGSLLRTRMLVEDISGRKILHYRPPYGVISRSSEQYLAGIELSIVGWHVSSKDWGIGVHYRNMISQIAAKGIDNKILLFHDGTGDPIQVTKVLVWLKRIQLKYGYNYCSLDEFFFARNRKKVEAGIKIL